MVVLGLLLSSISRSGHAQEQWPLSSIAAVALFQGEPGESLPDNANEYQQAFEISPGELVPSRMGGGVVLSIDDESGAVDLLTAAHLLHPAVTYSSTKPSETRIVVRLACSGLYFARVRAADPHSDLAVITVDVPEQCRSHLTAARFTNTPRWSQGDSALLSGNPRQFFRTGLSTPLSITVSKTEEMPDSWERHRRPLPLFQYLQRWDPVNFPGETESGNPVFTSEGELLGIASDIVASPGESVSAASVLYCIPPLQMRIDDLLNGYEVQYGDTGLELETIPPGGNSPQQTAHVRVLRALSGSPADRAGIRSGDIIVELNGKPVQRAATILEETLFLPPGTEVEMLVSRSGAVQQERMTFRLGKLDFPSRFPAVSTVDRWTWRGLNLDFPTPKRSNQPDPCEPFLPAGVLIRKVRKGSVGDAAGLKEGQLIAKVGEQPVETPEEFQSALQYWRGLVPLTLDDGREIQVDEDEFSGQKD